MWTDMKVFLIEQVGSITNKYLFSLGRSLVKCGVDVVCCVPHANNMKGYEYEYAAIFEDYGRQTGYLKKVGAYYRSWKRIMQYCEDNRITLVHAAWFIFSPVDYLFLRRLKKRGIKIVLTIHDVLPFNTKFYDPFFHRKIYAAADKIIYQSHGIDRLLEKDFGVASDTMVHIPHGHFMDFAEPADRDEARKHLGIDPGGRVVLFFGQIKKVKGLAVLLEAFSDIHRQFQDAVLVIAGKVWKDSFDSYESIIEKNGIGSSVVRHIRYIPDEEIKYYFAASDVVALPYMKIYQSGVLQLAYAYEKAVVATKIGGFLDDIIDGKTGLLVEPGNVGELSEAISRCLREPELGNEFGRRGREYLKDKLSWDKIGKSTKEVYEEVSGGI